MSPIWLAIEKNDAPALRAALALLGQDLPGRTAWLDPPKASRDAWALMLSNRKRLPLLKEFERAGHAVPQWVRLGSRRLPAFVVAFRHGLGHWALDWIRQQPTLAQEGHDWHAELLGQADEGWLSRLRAQRFSSGTTSRPSDVRKKSRFESMALPLSWALLERGVVPSPATYARWMNWLAIESEPLRVDAWVELMVAAWEAGARPPASQGALTPRSVWPGIMALHGVRVRPLIGRLAPPSPQDVFAALQGLPDEPMFAPKDQPTRVELLFQALPPALKTPGYAEGLVAAWDQHQWAKIPAATQILAVVEWLGREAPSTWVHAQMARIARAHAGLPVEMWRRVADCLARAGIAPDAPVPGQGASVAEIQASASAALAAFAPRTPPEVMHDVWAPGRAAHLATRLTTCLPASPAAPRPRL